MKGGASAMDWGRGPRYHRRDIDASSIRSGLPRHRAPCGGLGSGGAWSFAQTETMPPAANQGITPEILAVTQPSNAPGQETGDSPGNVCPGRRPRAHTHPGDQLIWLELGTLHLVVVEGEVPIQRTPSNGTPGPSEVLSSGQETDLNPGDSWVEPEAVVHYGVNPSSEPGVLWQRPSSPPANRRRIRSPRPRPRRRSAGLERYGVEDLERRPRTTRPPLWLAVVRRERHERAGRSDRAPDAVCSGRMSAIELGGRCTSECRHYGRGAELHVAASIARAEEFSHRRRLPRS